jgi:hypothetical protein
MEPEKKSNGATVGLIVILIILIVGGFYTWKSQMKVREPQVYAPITIEDEEELNELLEDLGTTQGEANFEVENIE